MTGWWDNIHFVSKKSANKCNRISLRPNARLSKNEKGVTAFEERKRG